MLLGIVTAVVVERGEQQKVSLVRRGQVRHLFRGDLKRSYVAIAFPCNDVVDQIRRGQRKDTVNMVP